ncbi:MAG: glycine C-acetyltransferase [Candidatus Paceibacterota bacterium]|jgi:glycine C-acetyltransferase|nr:glycine C-acetyltransferase [Candidatus Paceibacterota bacterium]
MTYSPKAKKVYADALAEKRAAGLYKDEYIITSPQGAWITVQFPEGALEKKVLNLCSNNYLGLSSHPDIVKAAHEGLDSRGYGMSSVRFICGTQDIHRDLERKMSEFLGTEDTILFGSCFDANGAVFEALLGEEDAIFSDQLVHASIIDGERLAKKVSRSIYPHSDMAELEKMLKESSARIKMIVTDGIFSMDGDMAKLDEIAALAEKYEAMVFVDDSHATGFIGKSGRGTHEYFNVMDKVDIITTTFGKALGGATGGCISGKKEMIAMLRQVGRPYLFSNALMPAVVTATKKVLETLTESTERRDKLADLAKFWRESLVTAGFDVKAGNTPIIPIMLYDAKLAQDFARELFEEGVYVRGFFYPVVAQGQARIRTQMSAGLEKTDLEKALVSFIKVGKKLNVLK